MSRMMLPASLLLCAACATTTPTPVVSSRLADAPDIVLPAHGAAAPLSVTRVAHATVLVDFDGEVVLTDPWFTDSSQYHHGEPLGLSLSSLPRLTAVVISHEHYDHFDIDAFRAYPDKDVPFLVVPGLAEKARQAGFRRVRELAPWQSATAGSLTITAAPGEHSVTEVTYVLQGKGRTVYFAADTKLIPALDELPRRFPRIDLALMPVNGLTVFGKQEVMSADEAAQLTRAIHAGVAVPMHYAYHGGRIKEAVVLSYNGTAERFLSETARLSPETQVKILAPGQRLRIRSPRGEVGTIEGEVTGTAADTVSIGPRRFPIAPELARQLRAGDRIHAELLPGPAWRIGKLRFLHRSEPTPEPPPDDGSLPLGALLPALSVPGIDGPVPLGARQGTPTVLAFLFTSCGIPTACPLVAQKLHRMQEEIRGQGRIVTITLDPELDTLATLRDYAAVHQADRDTWKLGRLELAELEPLLRQVGVVRVRSGTQLMHSLHLILLDGQGRLVWRSDGNTWEVADLAGRLRALSAEGRS